MKKCKGENIRGRGLLDTWRESKANMKGVKAGILKGKGKSRQGKEKVLRQGRTEQFQENTVSGNTVSDNEDAQKAVRSTSSSKQQDK